MFLWSSTCSRSIILLPSYLRMTAFDNYVKPNPRLCYFCMNNYRRIEWSLKSTADGSNISDTSESSRNRGTRLVRVIKSFKAKITSRIKKLMDGLPVKILFFLLGFYCATAFATVIGQTGDWDILSAGLAVVVVEGIGALMYKSSFGIFEKAKGLITMFNYWKTGLSLGLFLDSFKY